MKILVCANQKGGVGKTTIVVHLAQYFLEQGKRVAVIDFDHQMNTSFSLFPYRIGIGFSEILHGLQQHSQLEAAIAGKEANLYLIPPTANLLFTDMKKVSNAASALLSLDGHNAADLAAELNAILRCLQHAGIDIVLVDTPSARVPRVDAALAVANDVLSPIELESYSMQGIVLLLVTIKEIQETINNNLNFIGMLPNRVLNTDPRHKIHMKQLQDKYGDKLLPLYISQRGSIADAVSEKIPVWKIKRTAARPAAKEMKALGEYVLNKITE